MLDQLTPSQKRIPLKLTNLLASNGHFDNNEPMKEQFYLDLIGLLSTEPTPSLASDNTNYLFSPSGDRVPLGRLLHDLSTKELLAMNELSSNLIDVVIPTLGAGYEGVEVAIQHTLTLSRAISKELANRVRHPE